MESTNDKLDRISQLPDPIIHKILSLSCSRTRRAAQTMIFSKRWRDLWVSMPYIFLDNYKGQLYDQEHIPNFIQLVYSVLLLRDSSNIHTFCLWWRQDFGVHGQHHLNTWTEHVVRRDVKILELDVDVDEEVDEVVEVPPCVFTCQSIEKLKLVFHVVCVSLKLPELTGLGRLRELHIEHLDADCVSLKKLISGCPLLEDLEMNECKFKDPEFSSNSLKRLSVGNCEIAGTTIWISGPKLRCICFICNDTERLDVFLGNLSSLVDAFIQVDGCWGYRSLDVLDLKPLKFVALSNKRKSRDSEDSTFYNLKKLMLSGQHLKNNFQAIAYFLQRSPNLELLTLQEGCIPKKSLTHVYDCPHLKMEILFQCGEDNDSVIEMVEEILLDKCDCCSE